MMETNTGEYEGMIEIDSGMARAVVAMIEQILIPREVFNEEEVEIAQNIADYFRANLITMQPSTDPLPWDETGLTPEEKEEGDG